MAAKDSRVKRTTEIFNGIKYIKMCGSENKFMEIVYKSYLAYDLTYLLDYE